MKGPSERYGARGSAAELRNDMDDSSSTWTDSESFDDCSILERIKGMWERQARGGSGAGRSGNAMETSGVGVETNRKGGIENHSAQISQRALAVGSITTMRDAKTRTVYMIEPQEEVMFGTKRLTARRTRMNRTPTKTQTMTRCYQWTARMKIRIETQYGRWMQT